MGLWFGRGHGTPHQGDTGRRPRRPEASAQRGTRASPRRASAQTTPWRITTPPVTASNWRSSPAGRSDNEVASAGSLDAGFVSGKTLSGGTNQPDGY